MKSIIKILIKPLKQEIKHIIRFSILPLLGILLVGFAYGNPFIENIPFAIVNNDDSALSRTVISQFKNSPILKITSYPESESKLQEEIDNKDVVGGIIIPKDFGKDVSLSKAPKILITVDGTNMLLGGNALTGASTVLATLNAGAQLQVLRAKGLMPYSATQAIGNFSYVDRVLYEPQLSYMRNLGYTIVPFIVQLFFMTDFLVPLFIEKKEELKNTKILSKKALESLINAVLRIFIISTFFVVASFIYLCVLKKLFYLPLRGDLLIYAVLMYAFFFSLIGLGLLMAGIFNDKKVFLLLYQLLNMTFIITSGVVYPIYMMPQWLVNVIKNLWPFIHIALPLKFVNLKGSSWDVVMPYINELLKHSFIWLLIGIIVYGVSISIKKYISKIHTKKSEDLEVRLDENKKGITEEVAIE